MKLGVGMVTWGTSIVLLGGCLTPSGAKVGLPYEQLNELFRYRAQAIQLGLRVTELQSGDLPALTRFQQGVDRAYEARKLAAGDEPDLTGEQEALASRRSRLIQEVDAASRDRLDLVAEGGRLYDAVASAYNPAIILLQSSLSAGADEKAYLPAMKDAIERTSSAIQAFHVFESGRVAQRAQLTRMSPEHILEDESLAVLWYRGGPDYVATRSFPADIAASKTVGALVEGMMAYWERRSERDHALREKLRTDLDGQRLPRFDQLSSAQL